MNNKCLLTHEGRVWLRNILEEDDKWIVKKEGFADREGNFFSDEAALKVLERGSADTFYKGIEKIKDADIKIL